MRNYGVGAGRDGVLSETVYGIWADNAPAASVAFPSPEKARVGVLPLETYPAKWLNAFQNFNTKQLNEAAKIFQDLYTELLYVLQKANIVPSRLSKTQVYDAIASFIETTDVSTYSVTFAKSTVYSQIVSNSALKTLFGKLMTWYDKLVEQQNALNALSQAIANQIANAQTSETNLGTSITNESTARATEVSSLNSQIDAQNNTATTLENNNTNYKTRAGALETRLTNLEGRLSTIEGKTKNAPFDIGGTFVWNTSSVRRLAVNPDYVRGLASTVTSSGTTWCHNVHILNNTRNGNNTCYVITLTLFTTYSVNLGSAEALYDCIQRLKYNQGIDGSIKANGYIQFSFGAGSFRKIIGLNQDSYRGRPNFSVDVDSSAEGGYTFPGNYRYNLTDIRQATINDIYYRMMD